MPDKEKSLPDKMEKNQEFEHIGKATPYKVPADFFQNISEKTLLKARQREQHGRKRRILLRTVFAVASLAAVLFLSIYYIHLPDSKPEANVLTMEARTEQKEVLQTAKDLPVETLEKETINSVHLRTPATNVRETVKSEGITEVLADMSDEDLMQMVAMFKTDPFITETVQ
jgi:hypothetical protein